MTKDIQKAVGRNRVIARHILVCENIKYILNHEMDVISVKSGMLYEYEVKISRSDFIADKKKMKNNFNGVKGQLIPKWNANYFYYVCPDGLISIDEIPDFAGLYYFKDGLIWQQKKAKLHSDYKHSIEDITKKVINVYQERSFFDGVCLMTHKNREAIAEYNRRLLLNSEPNVQECDATGDDSSTKAG